MVKQNREIVQPNPPPVSESSRLQLVRQVGSRKYYIDSHDPLKKEFYIDDVSIPVSHVASDEQSERPLIKEVHPKHPTLGPYFFDKKEGRDVFLGNGKPFYFGKVNGSMHKIQLGVCHDKLIRSRAHAQLPAIISGSGTARLGGIGHN